MNEVYYSESSTRSNAPFAADGVEGVTTAAGADASGRLRLIRSKRPAPRPEPHRAAFRQRFEPESVGLGNELALDTFAPRAQASFFYAVILDVASALREHEDDAEDSPELEAKAMVVDESHHLWAHVGGRVRSGVTRRRLGEVGGLEVWR